MTSKNTQQQTTKLLDWIFDEFLFETECERVRVCDAKGYESEVCKRKEVSFYGKTVEFSSREHFRKIWANKVIIQWSFLEMHKNNG